jgi:hypothetical protein
VTAYTERRRGSRVSPRRRERHSTRHAVAGQTATRHTASVAGEDRRPFWIYVCDPERGLMVSDGLNYIGERCAQRQAVKLARYYGQPAEARLSPRA